MRFHDEWYYSLNLGVTIAVFQQPPVYHQCDNTAGQDGLTTFTNRPFAELPLKCLELVGKLGRLYQSHQMQPYRYWAGSST